jgi:hypothetical protein
MIRLPNWLPTACMLAAAPLANAAAATRPVVLELFTSESCSSCPPADALLVELARNDPSVLPLAFHVDYWDYLNWRDRFSSRAATARQRTYAASLGSEVYTPQMVIDGRTQAVGSDRAAVQAAVRNARAAVADSPALSVSRVQDSARIQLGAGSGSGAVLLIGYDPSHTTAIGGGENTGRTLEEANVVRGMARVATWNGAALDVTARRPAGERTAILVQGQNGDIIAAGLLP